MAKETTVLVGVKVTLPTTARDWLLYDMPGAGAAARALTAALRKALADPDGGGTEGRYFTHIAPVARHFIEFGAMDSEPRDTALDVLDKVFGGRS